jgi:hypothetical protein
MNIESAGDGNEFLSAVAKVVALRRVAKAGRFRSIDGVSKRRDPLAGRDKQAVNCVVEDGGAAFDGIRARGVAVHDGMQTGPDSAGRDIPKN